MTQEDYSWIYAKLKKLEEAHDRRTALAEWLNDLNFKERAAIFRFVQWEPQNFYLEHEMSTYPDNIFDTLERDLGIKLKTYKEHESH